MAAGNRSRNCAKCNRRPRPEVKRGGGAILKRCLLSPPAGTFAIGAVVLLLVSRATASDPSLLIYGIILVATGLAITFITALIGELIPRYTLPLWELLWAAGFVVGSGIESKLVGRRSGREPFLQRQRLVKQTGEAT